MKILLTGSEGQLGGELIIQGGRFNHHLLPFTYQALDITDETQVKNTVLDTQPDLIVNAAAYTFVDQAETDIDLAFHVNRDGPEILAKTCLDAQIPLIHLSTDYVFNGTSRIPYVETDPASPINIYGQTKEAGEQAVRARLNRHIILRTSWLYGVYGQNFVKTMLRMGKEKPVIPVVSDQFGCPTSVEDLAEAIFHMVSHMDKPLWGTYHFCNQGVISWFQFAKKIFESIKKYDPNLIPRVQPVTSDVYSTKAKRPMYSALNCDKITTCFGIALKPWEDSLEAMIQRIITPPT